MTLKKMKIVLLSFTLAMPLGAAAQELVSVAAAPLLPASATVLRFQMRLPAPVTTQWQMTVIMPPEFDLTQVLMAASFSLNGGLSVACNGDTLRVRRLGVGSNWIQPQPIDVAIATVGLPQDIEREYTFSFMVQDSLQTKSFTAQMPISAFSER